VFLLRYIPGNSIGTKNNSPQDYWVSGLRPPYGIAKNTTFWKLDVSIIG
jgi:hypothetical protein